MDHSEKEQPETLDDNSLDLTTLTKTITTRKTRSAKKVEGNITVEQMEPKAGKICQNENVKDDTGDDSSQDSIKRIKSGPTRKTRSQKIAESIVTLEQKGTKVIEAEEKINLDEHHVNVDMVDESSQDSAKLIKSGPIRKTRSVKKVEKNIPVHCDEDKASEGTKIEEKVKDLDKEEMKNVDGNKDSMTLLKSGTVKKSRKSKKVEENIFVEQEDSKALEEKENTSIIENDVKADSVDDNSQDSLKLVKSGPTRKTRSAKKAKENMFVEQKDSKIEETRKKMDQSESDVKTNISDDSSQDSIKLIKGGTVRKMRNAKIVEGNIIAQRFTSVIEVEDKGNENDVKVDTVDENSQDSIKSNQIGLTGKSKNAKKLEENTNVNQNEKESSIADSSQDSLKVIQQGPDKETRNTKNVVENVLEEENAENKDLGKSSEDTENVMDYNKAMISEIADENSQNSLNLIKTGPDVETRKAKITGENLHDEDEILEQKNYKDIEIDEKMDHNEKYVTFEEHKDECKDLKEKDNKIIEFKDKENPQENKEADNTAENSGMDIEMEALESRNRDKDKESYSSGEVQTCKYDNLVDNASLEIGNSQSIIESNLLNVGDSGNAKESDQNLKYQNPNGTCDNSLEVFSHCKEGNDKNILEEKVNIALNSLGGTALFENEINLQSNEDEVHDHEKLNNEDNQNKCKTMQLSSVVATLNPENFEANIEKGVENLISNETENKNVKDIAFDDRKDETIRKLENNPENTDIAVVRSEESTEIKKCEEQCTNKIMEDSPIQEPDNTTGNSLTVVKNAEPENLTGKHLESMSDELNISKDTWKMKDDESLVEATEECKDEVVGKSAENIEILTETMNNKTDSEAVDEFSEEYRLSATNSGIEMSSKSISNDADQEDLTSGMIDETCDGTRIDIEKCSDKTEETSVTNVELKSPRSDTTDSNSGNLVIHETDTEVNISASTEKCDEFAATQHLITDGTKVDFNDQEDTTSEMINNREETEINIKRFENETKDLSIAKVETESLVKEINIGKKNLTIHEEDGLKNTSLMKEIVKTLTETQHVTKEGSDSIEEDIRKISICQGIHDAMEICEQNSEDVDVGKKELENLKRKSENIEENENFITTKANTTESTVYIAESAIMNETFLEKRINNSSVSNQTTMEKSEITLDTEKKNSENVADSEFNKEASYTNSEEQITNLNSVQMPLTSSNEANASKDNNEDNTVSQKAGSSGLSLKIDSSPEVSNSETGVKQKASKKRKSNKSDKVGKSSKTFIDKIDERNEAGKRIITTYEVSSCLESSKKGVKRNSNLANDGEGSGTEVSLALKIKRKRVEEIKPSDDHPSSPVDHVTTPSGSKSGESNIKEQSLQLPADYPSEPGPSGTEPESRRFTRKRKREVEESLWPRNESPAAPIRMYLEKFVPFLLEGLLKITYVRPDDPIQYLADWMKENKEAAYSSMSNEDASSDD